MGYNRRNDNELKRPQRHFPHLIIVLLFVCNRKSVPVPLKQTELFLVEWDAILTSSRLVQAMFAEDALYIVGSLGLSSGSNASFDITADRQQSRLKGQVTAGATQRGWTLTLQTWLTLLGLCVERLHLFTI